MAYTVTNFKSGKALREAFKSGQEIEVESGLFGSTVADGNAVIEGPHYPAPHSFYVKVVVEGGKIVKINK